MSDYITDGTGWTTGERTYAAACKSAASDMAMAMFRHAPGYCLALLGQTTVGKTFLARLLCRWWNGFVRYAGGTPWRFEDTVWIPWPNHTFSQVEEAERSPGLVVLDEVGRGRTSATAAAGAIDRLVDFLTIREAHGLYTIVTANWTAKEVPDAALLERFRRNGSRCIEAPSELRPFSRR